MLGCTRLLNGAAFLGCDRAPGSTECLPRRRVPEGSRTHVLGHPDRVHDRRIPGTRQHKFARVDGAVLHRQHASRSISDAQFNITLQFGIVEHIAEVVAERDPGDGPATDRCRLDAVGDRVTRPHSRMRRQLIAVRPVRPLTERPPFADPQLSLGRSGQDRGLSGRVSGVPRRHGLCPEHQVTPRSGALVRHPHVELDPVSVSCGKPPRPAKLRLSDRGTARGRARDRGVVEYVGEIH